MSLLVFFGVLGDCVNDADIRDRAQLGAPTAPQLRQGERYGLYLYHPCALAVLGTLLGHIGLRLEALTGQPVADGVLQIALVTGMTFGGAVISFRSRWTGREREVTPVGRPATSVFPQMLPMSLAYPVRGTRRPRFQALDAARAS